MKSVLFMVLEVMVEARRMIQNGTQRMHGMRARDRIRVVSRHPHGHMVHKKRHPKYVVVKGHRHGGIKQTAEEMRSMRQYAKNGNAKAIRDLAEVADRMNKLQDKEAQRVAADDSRPMPTDLTASVPPTPANAALLARVSAQANKDLAGDDQKRRALYQETLEKVPGAEQRHLDYLAHRDDLKQVQHSKELTEGNLPLFIKLDRYYAKNRPEYNANPNVVSGHRIGKDGRLYRVNGTITRDENNNVVDYDEQADPVSDSPVPNSNEAISRLRLIYHPDYRVNYGPHDAEHSPYGVAHYNRNGV
ncbi:hypothetical protein ENBRE01_2931, partial [Enteropsectra breve]